MKLKDRVALITGGSSGIGRAAAVAMAREGANIALTARRAERCEEAVAEIEGLGGQALALPGDVANAKHIAGLVAASTSSCPTPASTASALVLPKPASARTPSPATSTRSASPASSPKA